MKILIRNGYVVDPVNSIKGKTDIYLSEGKIAAPFGPPYDKVIDATGLYVFPGLIDAHCHLRDPGFEYREDIETGTASAAKGGFTSVACMPNTSPVCDNATVVEYIKSKAKKVAKTNVFPIGAISKGLQGVELAEIGLMAAEGIVAVTDDGRPIESSGLMLKAMTYASDFGLTVISHCEDTALVNDGQMNEGYTSTMMGIRGNPSISEDVMVARDVMISGYLGIPVHIAHVSTKGSVQIIRDAKRRGVQVTCETCPHYFTLTEEECLGYNTMAKMNPPLRTSDDVAAVIEGLTDGTIDMIVTDHAPHHADEKEIEFSLANNGIVGFESAFGLAFTYLVKDEIMSIDKLIRLMSVNPSNLLKLGRGNLSVGSPADITIADVDNEYDFKRSELISKSKNTPYDGWKLFGSTVYTIVGGRVNYDKFR
ncbi:MAG: dihydroorotase [Saccharofermentanales bacterium]